MIFYIEGTCNQGEQHAGKGKHYVIGDVHGCYEDFLLLKEKIEREIRRQPSF